MNRSIAIASGKGGVGKTTATLNIASAIASFGYQAIVVDGNFSTPNVALHLGAPQLPITLHNVIQGKNKIEQAIYSHPAGFRIVPSSVSIHDHDENFSEKSAPYLDYLSKLTHLTIFDTCPGISRETTNVLKIADSVVVVTTPDLPSVMDSLRTIKVAERMGKKIEGILINMSRNESTELSVDNIQTLLERPVIANIPYDPLVREALSLRHPVVYAHPDCSASIGYTVFAAKLIGVNYEIPKKKAFWWW